MVEIPPELTPGAARTRPDVHKHVIISLSALNNGFQRGCVSAGFVRRHPREQTQIHKRWKLSCRETKETVFIQPYTYTWRKSGVKRYRQNGSRCICHMEATEKKTGGSNSTETKADRCCRWSGEETSMFVPVSQEITLSQPIREKNEKAFKRKCWWRQKRQMKSKKCNSSSCSAKG